MTEKKPILVTGASGFIATHTIIQLLNKGYAVRGTLRNLSRGDSLKAILGAHAPVEGLSFVQADLTDAASWGPAVAGCAAIMHIASPITSQLPKDPQAMIGPACEGTRAVLQAAIDQQVPRVIITSSVVAVAYGHGANAPEVYTEEHFTNPEHPEVNAYGVSKTLAERLAWEMAREAGEQLQVTTIHPSLVLGPVLENDYGSSAEVIKRLMDGSLPMYPYMGFPIVDVLDCAAMHVMALENPKTIGERYICSGPFLWFPEVIDILRNHFPKAKLPKRRMPDWFVHVFAMFMPELKQVKAELNTKREMSWAKAEKDLGWKPRPLEESLVATGETLISYGIVKG